MKHKGLNQLLCAATVNDRFRNTLLHNPAQALAMGYLDHTFSLTPEERELVLGIQAQKLEDFAVQVYLWISANGRGHNGNGRNGYGPKRDFGLLQACQPLTSGNDPQWKTGIAALPNTLAPAAS